MNAILKREDCVNRTHYIAPFLYGLFLLAMIIDVGGAFGLKYLAFMVLIAYLVMLSLENKRMIPAGVLIFEGILFGVLPLFFGVLSITAFAIDPTTVIGELTPFATWLIYPVLLLVRPRQKLISIFSNIMFWGAVLILVLFLLILFSFYANRLDVIYALNTFARTYNLGYFGQKPFDNYFSFFFPNVYFRWTLMLVPVAVLLYGCKHTGKLVVTIVAILVTLSTGAILALLLGLAWASLDAVLQGKDRRIYMRGATIILVSLAAIATGAYLSEYRGIIDFTLAKLSGASGSTFVKIGHIQSILDIVTQSPFTLLFGTGVGSSFYSAGVDRIVSNVEVSHFNLIRQFGLIYALAFFSYVSLVFVFLRRLDQQGRFLGIGLMVMFIASGTNPVLVSPIFFLVLATSRAYITLMARETRAAQDAEALAIGRQWAREGSGA